MDVDDLIERARSGDRRAHLRVLEEHRRGNISISYGSASVKIGGDVIDSIVIAGNNNNIITLESGSYQDFDELVSAIAEQSVRREMSIHLSQRVLKGRKSVFDDARLAEVFKDALNIIAQRALSGDTAALTLIRELEVHSDNVLAKLDDLVEYLIGVFRADLSDAWVIETCAEICWAMGAGTKLRDAVDQGQREHPHSHRLLACRAAVLEQDGKFSRAFDTLHIMLIDSDEIDVQSCEIQAFARDFSAHLLKMHIMSSDAEDMKDKQAAADRLVAEAEQIYTKFHARKDSLIPHQIAFRKRHGLDLGALADWEEDNPVQKRRDAAFDKGLAAFEQEDMVAARLHFMRALKLDRERSHLLREIEDLRYLARTFLATDEPETGIAHLTEAIELIKVTGCQPEMRGALVSMAELCLHASLTRSDDRYVDTSKFVEFMQKAEEISRRFDDQRGLEALQWKRRITEEFAEKWNADVDRDRVFNLRHLLIGKLDDRMCSMVFDALDFSLENSKQADFALAKALLEESETLGVAMANRKLILRAFRKDLLAEMSGLGVMGIGAGPAHQIFARCGFAIDEDTMDVDQAMLELEQLHED